MKCNCDRYKALELIRDDIAKRIKESKDILKTLELRAKSDGGNSLYQCSSCGQFWQESLAWNWDGKTYLFKVPKTEIEEWRTDQFVSPADMLIFSAYMSDYFKKNKLVESINKCRLEHCINKAIEGNVLCKEHLIENLQKFDLLPKTPRGKLFEPYKFD